MNKPFNKQFVHLFKMGWIVRYVTTSGDDKVYSGIVHEYKHQAEAEAGTHQLSFVSKVYVARGIK